MFLDILPCISQSDEVVNWIDLPNELWEHILGYLDRKTLIQTTEVCVKLKEIIELNPKLFDKVWLRLQLADEEDFDEGLRVIQKSKRKYKQLYLHCIKKHWFHNELFIDVLKQTSESVASLVTSSIHFPSRKSLVSTLRMFTHLKRLEVHMVVIEGEENPETKYLNEYVFLPKLVDLYLVEYYPWICDVLSPCVNIKRLESYLIKWLEDDPALFEDLLFKQKSLKKLRLGIFRQGRLFKVDRSGEVQFQLDHLLLDGAFFASKENLLMFLQTQKKLKKLQINLAHKERRDNLYFYHEVMEFIFTDLSELTSLTINQDKFNFPSLDFILSMPPNNKIQDLHIQGQSVDIFTALITSVLPNIKHLNYELNSFSSPLCIPPATTMNLLENLESLIMDMFFVESLNEIHIKGGKLKAFEYVARGKGEEFEKYMRVFLERHQTLTRLRIGVFYANVFVPMKTCEDIAKNLPLLESLNIQNFEDANASVSYLANEVKLLKLLEVSQQQYDELTASSFNECVINGVCILVGK